MPLSAGTRLGSFEIHAPLGQGGMGEVYRARDLKLARDVAIKILPAGVATDPDRLARFGREAQVVASLNHPYIAQIYGLEDAGGVRAIVMELVEGPTLAERIAERSGGPGARGIPIDDALPIARQIAEALEAAHERGIVHRDLKPANVKVRPDGTVKVLDFGLARAIDDPTPAASASAAMSPTLSVRATEAGMILGTAAYMSPEQAAGKAADRRSDLWAFGVVLLEMLTGRPAFTGETVSHVLAAVLKSDPDWSALPGETPVPIRRLLRRCLEKDRKRRLDSASDARLEIEDALAAAGQEPVSEAAAPRRGFTPIVAGVAAAAAIVAALGTWIATRGAPPPPAFTSRFVVRPSASQPLRISQFENILAVSPDGRQFVYSARFQDVGARAAGTGGTLMLRALDRLEARPVVPVGRTPFFSPDGAWLAYFDDNDFVLKKTPISGGPPVDICHFVGGPRGAAWSGDNTIVFGTGDPATGLWRVPAGGGEPVVLTRPDATQPLGDHLFPSPLPGGHGILFTIAEPGQPGEAQVAVLDTNTGQHRTLIRGGSQARYVESGHLVYAAAGTLRAVRFDLERLQVLGDPVPVVEDVMMTSIGAAFYDVSPQGTLIYVSGDTPAQPPRSLTWIDRQGREEPLKAPVRPYAAARLSPDGTRVALDIRDQENDIWIWDLGRETIRKLTHGPAVDQNPVWTPDGRHLVFASGRAGLPNLYMQAADGSGPVQRLTTSHTAQWPTAMTPDGTMILGHEFGAATSFDLFLFRFGNRSGEASQPILQEPVAQTGPALSPDGRYLSYQSNESGRFEVYVRPFPDLESGRWQVSTEGGTRAVWAKKGGELFYADRSGALVAVPVETSGPTFAWGSPVRILDATLDDTAVSVDAAVNVRAYDVAPDGRRFLMLRDVPASTSKKEPAHVVVVLHWLEELKARLPPGEE